MGREDQRDRVRWENGGDPMLVMAEGCDLDVDRGPGWMFIRLRSHEDDPLAFDGLADRIWELLEKHLTYRVVLEMDEIEVLPRALIAELMQLHQRLEEHEGIIRLTGLSYHGRQVLRDWHVNDRLPMYGNRVAAVMGAPGQPR